MTKKDFEKECVKKEILRDIIIFQIRTQMMRSMCSGNTTM